MAIGGFACSLQMRDAQVGPVETIASLAGLSRSRKGLAAALAIFMFSMAGIPPLFGFWAKFLVFDAAVAAGLTALAAFGIAMSVIGARSEERRVGKECCSKCKSWWWPNHYKKYNIYESQIDIQEKQKK